MKSILIFNHHFSKLHFIDESKNLTFYAEVKSITFINKKKLLRAGSDVTYALRRHVSVNSRDQRISPFSDVCTPDMTPEDFLAVM